ATDFERSEVLVPESIGCFRLRFPPDFQPVQILDRDLPILQAIKQVVAKSSRKIRPLDFGHHSPKVMRASSSLMRCRSAESGDSVSRLASSKNRCLSASLE